MSSDYKILFVDDESAIVSILCRHAETIGYEAIGCTSPAQAMEELKKHHNEIILIISDVKMPDMDGFQFRKEVLPLYKDIPFAILSGYVNRQMALEAVDYQICAFVEKPASGPEIEDLITTKAADRIDQLNERAILRNTFIEEATSIIDELEPLILSLESNPHDQNTLNTIFRLIHTIKGSSGILESKDIGRYLHRFEDLLAKIKSGAVSVTPEVVSLLLKGFDTTQVMIQALSDNTGESFDIDRLTAIFDLDSHQTQPPATQDNSRAEGTKPTQAQSSDKSKVTVSTELLDDLLEKSGEMTVLRNMVNKLVAAIDKSIPGNENVSLLGSLLNEMHKINSIIQSSIADIRKVPLSKVFRTIPRTVRDTARSLGKKTNLEVKGDELRVDTSIAQTLSDSLTHIVRNAVDHGMEPPDERLTKSKPESGSISLSAFQDGENIVIEIADDGRGIDPLVIAKKALEKEVISQERADSLSKQQILSLIFHPGFSTAEKITDVSGRGVGMDMVKNSVENAGGTIVIDSEKELGTKFQINLPIPKSVIIIDALLVRCGAETLAFPQDDILRLIHLTPEQSSSLVKNVAHSAVLDYQGSLLPIVELTDTLGLTRQTTHNMDSFVIAEANNYKYAISVDEILDSEEVVIKDVQYLTSLPAFKGATFTGDGKVALILDVEGLVNSCLDREESDDEHFAETDPKLFSKGCGKTGTIIFDLSEANPFAIDGSSVFRLEVFPADKVQWSNNIPVITYRGTSLPLVSLNSFLDLNSHSYIDQDCFNVIVIEVQSTLIGLIVDEVIDINNIDLNLHTENMSSPFFLGIMEIGGKLTTFLDMSKIVHEFMGIAEPESSDADPLTEDIKAAKSEVAIDPPSNARMGFF